ncbi:ROK family protein [Halobacillus shinanisalinarum]|uniref:ROK family protein n=1 Tax=Halobacillus shinanisalinarum TaxID=2932258 RepID=A0ABY4GY44_9BACI|nr:ROK family protein [Halobacillus shinanisalinarum]UOQ92342.1 ROK family protein [Halobacillus shinanisalinarum]
MKLLGVFDIGGTSIKYGVVNEVGDILYKDAVPTEAYLGGVEVINKVNKLGDELIGDYEINGIAISSAGQIDSISGTVVFATDNIPNYTGTPVAEIVSNHTGLPVKVENDVNCTALGEYWKGAAVGVDDFLCVTIGTGIGGALFLHGKLYTGSHFSAGELGHINLYPHGKPCTCGNQGCFENYASSSALAEMVTTAFGYEVDLKEFFAAAKQGDALAVEIFDSWIEDMTIGLRSLVHIFNPELIVIGGGVTAQGDFLQRAIQDSLLPKTMPNHRRSLQVKLAEHDNKANLLGAAKHYLMTQ